MKRKSAYPDDKHNDRQAIYAKDVNNIFAQLTILAMTVWDIEDTFVTSPIKPRVPVALHDIFGSLCAYFTARKTGADSKLYKEKWDKILLSAGGAIVTTQKRRFTAEKALILNEYKVNISSELVKINDGLTQKIISQQLGLSFVTYYLYRQYLYYKHNMNSMLQLPKIPEKNREDLEKIKLCRCLKKHEFYLTRNPLIISLVFWLLKSNPTPENISRAILFSFVGREIPSVVQEEISKEIVDFLTSPLWLDPMIMQALGHLRGVAFGMPRLLTSPVLTEIKYPLTKIESQEGSDHFFPRVKADLYGQIRILLDNKKSHPNNCILLCTALIHYINLGQLPTGFSVDRVATLDDYNIDALYSPVAVKVESSDTSASKKRLRAPTMVTTSAVLARNSLLNTAIDHGIPARESFVTTVDGRVDPEREIILLDGIEDTDSDQQGVRVSNLNPTLKAYAKKSETGFFTAILNLCRIQQGKQKTAPAHSMLVLATMYEVVYCEPQYFNYRNINYTRSKVFTGALANKSFIGGNKLPKPSQDTFGDIIFLDPTGYQYAGLLQPPVPKIKKEPATPPPQPTF